MRNPLKLAVSVVMAAAFLVSCNSADNTQAAGSSGDIDLSKLDPGPYTSKYLTEVSTDIPDAMGQETESFLIGQNLLLPYEVSEAFHTMSLSRPLDSTGLAEAGHLPDDVKKELAGYRNQYQSGYLRSASDDGDYFMDVAVARYDIPETAKEVAEKSKIKHGVSTINKVWKAPEEVGAKLFQSVLIGDAEGWNYEEYEEPQGVPNTRCFERGGEEAQRYICVLYYGNFAVMSTLGNKDKPADDAKKRLSQRMAAQYLIFKDAETNPAGVPLNEAVQMAEDAYAARK